MEKELKTAVMTGATGGIGTVICSWLLQHDFRILAACRNVGKWEKLLAALQERGCDVSRMIRVDANLESFRSVDAFCSRCVELSGRKIDVLLNNAGMIAPEFKVTEDGYERSMQVNFLSAKRITEALLPYMERGSKVINTLSCTVKKGNGILPEKAVGDELEKQRKAFMNLKNYSNTKLMLARYTRELYLRHIVTVMAFDPGIVNTGIITMHRWYDPLANIFFRPFIKTPAQGAAPALNALAYDTKKAASGNGPLLFKGSSHAVLQLKPY